VFSEILKFRPKIDSADLNRMINTLQTRFTNVAKKFGSGMKSALKGLASGALFGAALGFIDKLLNPLKETEESIKRLLGEADDLATMAAQFETTAGKLFKLRQIGVSVGLSGDELNVMMGKFQVALAEARKDETDPTKKEADKTSPVRRFIGEKDTAQAFFDFIRALQVAKKDDQILIQQQVFGEKLINKQAELLQIDLLKRIEEIGLKDSSVYDRALSGWSNAADQNDLNTAKRNEQDVLQKEKLITKGMIVEIDRGERQKLRQENKNLQDFEMLKNAAVSVDKIAFEAKEIFKLLYGFIPTVIQGVDKLSEGVRSITVTAKEWLVELKKLTDSPLMRLKGLFK
jgi:hypothetical protein